MLTVLIFAGFVVLFGVAFANLNLGISAVVNADPNNPNNLDILKHGGPLPDRYVKLSSVVLVAVEHNVERTPVADLHVVRASVINSDDKYNALRVWLVTDMSSYTKYGCGGGYESVKLQPDKTTIVSGCFAVQPGEQPSAAFLISSHPRTPLSFSEDTYAALPLPLFGASIPLGMTCDKSQNGTVCVNMYGQ